MATSSNNNNDVHKKITNQETVSSEEFEFQANNNGVHNEENSGEVEEGYEEDNDEHVGEDDKGHDENEVNNLAADVAQNESFLQQDKESYSMLYSQTQESREESDHRSIFVQNVDYSTNEMDLQVFFKDCGPVRRVTIGRGPNGKPKGYAYVEFTDATAVETAKSLSNQILKGRAVVISNKRTNIPGLRKRGRSRGRGRGRYSTRGRRGRARRARGYAVYFSTT
eukprot:gene5933-9095_t